MQSLERLIVRTASFAIVAGSVVLAAFMHSPARLPAVAFGSAVLLFLERSVVVLAVFLFLLVVLYRGWRGELPTSLSGKGAEWEPIAHQNNALERQIAELRVQLETLRARCKRLERGGLR
jgi:hypothetical protein